MRVGGVEIVEVEMSWRRMEREIIINYMVHFTLVEHSSSAGISFI